MGNTKRIREPKDLYKLPHEQHKPKPVSTDWITDEDLQFIKAIVSAN